jgi:hypothetical protein
MFPANILNQIKKILVPNRDRVEIRRVALVIEDISGYLESFPSGTYIICRARVSRALKNGRSLTCS